MKGSSEKFTPSSRRRRRALLLCLTLSLSLSLSLTLFPRLPIPSCPKVRPRPPPARVRRVHRGIGNDGILLPRSVDLSSKFCHAFSF